MTLPAMTRPDVNYFKPRICFFDRKNCSACGKCQKTYYCDSFLDRVNITGLPPQMDTRNCTGCGLCVQVCETGALHLYHPSEFTVLISSSEERQELLRSLDIPFLAYDPEKDLCRFSQPDLQMLYVDVGQEIDLVCENLKKAVDTIWSNRLADQFILGDNKSEDYKDCRKDRQKECERVSDELINELRTTQNSYGKLSLARAVIWSQLIWSDPGQVLWDSFLLTAQTYLESEKTDGSWEVVNLADTQGLRPNCFHRRRKYRISSYVVLLRQGSKLLSQALSSTSFHFSDVIFDSRSIVDAYNAQDMGRNRMAGLDTRSCGHFLIKEFKEIKESDRLAMAGLPWSQICELLKKGEHAEYFKNMRTAMMKRNNKAVRDNSSIDE